MGMHRSEDVGQLLRDPRRPRTALVQSIAEHDRAAFREHFVQLLGQWAALILADEIGNGHVNHAVDGPALGSRLHQPW